MVRFGCDSFLFFFFFSECLLTPRPLYMIGMLFEIPTSPPGSYLTLSLRGLGFTTFQVNLLAIPLNVLSSTSPPPPLPSPLLRPAN